MWSIQGKQIVHQSGLVIEVTEGSFNNPMDLAIKGGKELAAPKLALMIREGIDFATNHNVDSGDNGCAEKPKRPILKLKRDS